MAVSNQRSAVGGMAVSNQPSAVGGMAVSNQPSAVGEEGRIASKTRSYRHRNYSHSIVLGGFELIS